jgi:hypothetical protein
MQTPETGAVTSRVTPQEFIAAELLETQDALSRAILNRRKWDLLREDQRVLEFLQARAGALDFRGVRVELECMARGEFSVPGIAGSRSKAQECLRRWAANLDEETKA